MVRLRRENRHLLIVILLIVTWKFIAEDQFKEQNKLNDIMICLQSFVLWIYNGFTKRYFVRNVWLVLLEGVPHWRNTSDQNQYFRKINLLCVLLSDTTLVQRQHPRQYPDGLYYARRFFPPLGLMSLKGSIRWPC